MATVAELQLRTLVPQSLHVEEVTLLVVVVNVKNPNFKQSEGHP